MRIKSSKFFRRIFGFNMVEVALAMLVISLGLTTVLVLFPSGLKASRQADEEMQVADAVDALETYIRLNHSDIGVDVLGHDSSAGTADSVLETSFSPTSNTNKYRAIIALNNSTAKAFLYRKLVEMNGEVITEFSCIARLLRADLGKGIGASASSDSEIGYFPTFPSGFEKIEAGDGEKGKVKGDGTLDYFQVIDLEVSYPADKPYGERKKRVYRLEIFDENYTARETE